MGLGKCCLAGTCLFALLGTTQPASAQEPVSPAISLAVPSGAPLRLYLTNKVSKRAGAPVEAKVMEPVFAFDRVVIPEGSVVTGKVDQIHSLTKWRRFLTILNGDFTPLHTAYFAFDRLKLPDGEQFALQTADTRPLNSLYVRPRKNKKHRQSPPQAQNGGILGTAKQSAKDQIASAVSTRTQGISDVVRAPNKKERLEDYLWGKLPYRPQYVRRYTRVDAPLAAPLAFGSAAVKPAEFARLGSQPSPDSVVRARLLTPLDSATAKPGEKVEAAVVEPLFAPDHKELLIPEGTKLEGVVTVAKKGRSFHRAGQLRFRFDSVELPPETEHLRAAAAADRKQAFQTQAVLGAAESAGPTPIAVDSEGGVHAKESKTRFLAPLASLMVASRAADNDAGHHHSTGSGGEANVGGRTLGGGMGFGLVGAAVSQSSPLVGMAFGYYGLAWSVYSNVIARGGEVQFQKNAMVDIRFSNRAPKAGSKFLASSAVGTR